MYVAIIQKTCISKQQNLVSSKVNFMRLSIYVAIQIHDYIVHVRLPGWHFRLSFFLYLQNFTTANNKQLHVIW